MIKTMQKRIEEIKQADRKAYYELANEIGISEYSLYNFMINKYSANTEEKISKFLKDYKTKDEQIAQWKHEYEVLDACCELAQGKIAELKAENDRLKEEITEVKKYQYQQEYLDKEIEEMQKALKTLAEGLNKRQMILQEIKAIAEVLSCKNSEDCWENKPDWNGEVYGCDVADNWKKPSDLATCPSKLASAILQIITKAEEE